jgi:hypothetical protein
MAARNPAERGRDASLGHEPTQAETRLEWATPAWVDLDRALEVVERPAVAVSGYLPQGGD